MERNVTEGRVHLRSTHESVCYNSWAPESHCTALPRRPHLEVLNGERGDDLRVEVLRPRVEN